MKRTILALSAMLLTVCAFALLQEPKNMVVKQKDGTEVKYKVSSVEQVYFEEAEPVEYEYVDLGLPSGTKWATFNLGATAPEEAGDYYGWGCIEPYADDEEADQCSYSTHIGSDECLEGSDWAGTFDPLHDYVTESNSIAGTQWDAVNATLGGNWRMPEYDEVYELMSKCIWVWDSGKNGYTVTGPSGKSIFMPQAGYRNGNETSSSAGYYWSASPRGGSRYEDALSMSFNSSSKASSTYYRWYGLSIRPVYAEPQTTPVPEAVDLGLPSGTKWASFNLGATAPEEAGNYYGWGCPEPYKNIVAVDWGLYFKRLGSPTGRTGDDCGNEADPLKDYVLNNKSIAGTEWDAAHNKLGGNWRMPDNDDIDELLNQCTWVWNSEKKGFMVTGPSGKSIFLPMAGGIYEGESFGAFSGNYWSTNPYTSTSTYTNAYTDGCSMTFGSYEHNRDKSTRLHGLSIRPVYVEPKPEPVYEYVDLGLPSGTKWATFNLGASSPEEAGDYYGWGCPEPYKDGENVDWPLYFDKLGGSGTAEEDCGTDKDPMKDFVGANSKSIAGTEWDAVHNKLGDKWHMPTVTEMRELIDNCTWTLTTENGVEGYRVTGNNDNSIFYPTAGRRYKNTSLDCVGEYGDYWISSTNEKDQQSGDAGVFRSGPGVGEGTDTYPRDMGLPIRPVYGDIYIKIDPKYEYVDLGLPSGTKWATFNLGASKPEEAGDYYGWGCPEPYADGESANWTTYFEKLGVLAGTSGTSSDCGTDMDPLKDYVTNLTSIAGTEFDVAYTKLGGNWRMPSKEEFEELLSKCTWTWSSEKNGYTVTGPNDKSIFMPISGFINPDLVNNSALYWSGDPNYVSNGYFMYYDSSSKYTQYTYRSLGATIRPVYAETIPEPDYVDLGLPSGTKWATCNLGATSFEEYGDHYGWGCATPYASEESADWTTYFKKIGGSGTSEEDCGTDKDPLADYVSNGTSISGTEFDPARVKLGSKWHMPTYEDFQELVENCNWTPGAFLDSNGYWVTSKKDSSKVIFLPAAGYLDGSSLVNYGEDSGYYWIPSPYSGMVYAATDFEIKNNGYGPYCNYRYVGFSIRPVRK